MKIPFNGNVQDYKPINGLPKPTWASKPNAAHGAREAIIGVPYANEQALRISLTHVVLGILGDFIQFFPTLGAGNIVVFLFVSQVDARVLVDPAFQFK